MCDRGARSRRLLDGASGTQVVVATFEDLDGALLARHRPDVVICSAISRRFDALDLARRLATLGFGGRLVALAAALPHPDLVRAEVRRACPSLAFDVVVTGSADERPTMRAV